MRCSNSRRSSSAPSATAVTRPPRRLAARAYATDLKDLANPISVVTREFMHDDNATDPRTCSSTPPTPRRAALAATTPAPVSAARRSSPTHAESAEQQPRPRPRARDLTRDYFPTTIVFRRLQHRTRRNQPRAQRHALRLGSPGGIINTSSSSPRSRMPPPSSSPSTTRGSTRSVLDVDRVLIPGRFGVRLRRTQRREQFEQNRLRARSADLRRDETVAVQGRRVSREFRKGLDRRNRPRSDAPRDNLTRWWHPRSTRSRTARPRPGSTRSTAISSARPASGSNSRPSSMKTTTPPCRRA